MKTVVSKLAMGCGLLVTARCDAGTAAPIENSVTAISVHFGKTTGVGLNLGDSVRLSPTFTFAFPGDHPTPVVQYRSSNPAAVTVSSDGWIKAADLGIAWVVGSVATSGRVVTDSMTVAVGRSMPVSGARRAGR
jgi:hypothetical protein